MRKLHHIKMWFQFSPLRPPQQYELPYHCCLWAPMLSLFYIQHIWCMKIPIVFLQNPAPAAGFIPLLSYYLPGFIVTNGFSPSTGGRRTQTRRFAKFHPVSVKGTTKLSWNLPGSVWFMVRTLAKHELEMALRRVVRSKARPDRTRSILHGYFNPLVFWYYLFTNRQRI